MSSSLELPAPIGRIKGSNAQADGLDDGLVVAIGQSIRDEFSDGISEGCSTWRGMELSVEVVKVFLDFLLGEVGDGTRRLGEGVRGGGGTLSSSRSTSFRPHYGPVFSCCGHLVKGLLVSQGADADAGFVVDSE